MTMRHPAGDERLFALLSSPLARLQVRDELWRYYFAYYTMLMAAALALLVRFGFDLLDRWLIPAPLRKAGRIRVKCR